MIEGDLVKRNKEWIKDINKHTYPLAQADIAAIIGVSPSSYNKILKGVYWLYPEQYKTIMDIDVSMYLETCPEVKSRTERRLHKIVEESELASVALEKFFK